jgi:hypothetical protein
MATVLLMPAKADPTWIRALDAFCLTVGTNCRGFVNRSPIEVGVWWFVEGVNTSKRFGMMVTHVYPALDPATVMRPYVLL